MRPSRPDDGRVGVVQRQSRSLTRSEGRPDASTTRQLSLTSWSHRPPGDSITVPLDAVSTRIINSYAVQVTASGTSLTPVDCDARAGATCSIVGKSVRIISDGDVSLIGAFHLGDLTFKATQTIGQSDLKVAGSATLPDDYDPPIQVK